MNNQELIKTLKRADACPDAIKWVGKRDLKTAWAECQHADWMVSGLTFMLEKPGWPTLKELVSIAAYCVRRAYRFVQKDPGNRIINCIEAVEARIKNPGKKLEMDVQRARVANRGLGRNNNVINAVDAVANAVIYASAADSVGRNAAKTLINTDTAVVDIAAGACADIYMSVTYAAGYVAIAVDSAINVAYTAEFTRDARDAEHKVICDHIRQTVKIPV